MINNRRMSLQNAVTDKNENPLQQMINNSRASLQNVVTNSNENPLQQMISNRIMSLPNIMLNSAKLLNLNNDNISDHRNDHRLPKSSTSNSKSTLNSPSPIKKQKVENNDTVDASSSLTSTSNNKKKKLLSVNNNDEDAPSSNDTASSLITASTISDSGSNKLSVDGHDSSDSDTNDLEKKSSDSLKLQILKAPPKYEENWMQKYEELVLFVKENGNCCIPPEYSKNPKLGDWAEYVRKQRKQFAAVSSPSSESEDGEFDKITKKRIQLLDSIGFVWDSEEVKWRMDLSFLKKIEQQQKKKRKSSKNADHHSKFKKIKSNLVEQYLNYYEGRSTSLASRQIVELEKLGFSRFLTKV